MMRSSALVRCVCAGVRWTWVQIPDLLFMSCGTLNKDVALPTLGFLISTVGMITAPAWKVGGSHSVTYSESGPTHPRFLWLAKLIPLHLGPECISLEVGEALAGVSSHASKGCRFNPRSGQL